MIVGRWVLGGRTAGHPTGDTAHDALRSDEDFRAMGETVHPDGFSDVENEKNEKLSELEHCLSEIRLLVSDAQSERADIAQKLAIVDAWAESENIDIFSPQLYTSGVEEEPAAGATKAIQVAATEAE